MPKTSLTDQDMAEIAARYAGGQTISALCKEFRIAQNRVYQALQRASVSVRPAGGRPGRSGPQPTFTPDQDREIAAKYQGGIALTELSRIYDVSARTITKALRRVGVALNPRGGRIRKFSDEEIEEILRRYDAGESRWKIGQSLSAENPVMDTLLKAHGREIEVRIPRGDKVAHWKGGRYISTHGYVEIFIQPEHWLFDHAPKRPDGQGRYIKEHRLVMAESLGRPLLPWEDVHHKNGDRADNRLENLQLRIGKHGRGVTFRCRCCGSTDVEYIEV